MPLNRPQKQIQRPAGVNAMARPMLAVSGLRQGFQRPSGVNSPTVNPMAAPLTMRQAYAPKIGLSLGT